MGSGTHCLKVDGFPGTHRTHANGATDLYVTNTKTVIIVFDLSNQGE